MLASISVCVCFSVLLLRAADATIALFNGTEDFYYIVFVVKFS